MRVLNNTIQYIQTARFSDTSESNRYYLTRELVKHLANRMIALSVKGLDALVSNLSNDLYLDLCRQGV